MQKISIKLNATPEQIAQIKELSNKRVPGKLYSPRGKYLIEEFGEVISEAIFENIPPEGFDDVIDGRGEDDGLLSYAISQAKIFSEGMLDVFPISHPDLPQDHVDRMRTLIKSCSFIGFRRGYLQGHADAKQQEDGGL